MAVLAVPASASAPAAALVPAVQLTGTAADINTSQFVTGGSPSTHDTNGTDFLTFARHLAPAKLTGVEGSASAFASQASSMETPGQPPFPTGPLNDIGLNGTVTSGATATGQGSAVPVAFSEGTLTVDFDTSTSVPIFFSGALHVTETDSTDNCSYVTVDLTGSIARHFKAGHGTGSPCSSTTPRQKAFAQSITLPAGSYELAVDYYSEVDDTVPNEPASMSASATVSLNLTFLPPTARFTKTLSGFAGHFDGSGSSVGDPNRQIAKWKWNFGDGRSATTTTPKVAHTYPASPRGAPTYTVTLQVVDSAGGLSPPVQHTVLGTATTLTVSRTSSRVTAAGAVHPSRAGRSMDVTLTKKRNGVFRLLATHHPTLSATSHYSTRFVRPTAGMCRIIALYPGDAGHLASQKAKTFAC
jgi:hypothetical protein